MRLIDEWCEQWFSRDAESLQGHRAASHANDDDDDDGGDHDTRSKHSTSSGLDAIEVAERLTPQFITSFRASILKLIDAHHPPISTPDVTVRPILPSTSSSISSSSQPAVLPSPTPSV
jgi:hypothetical protein